MQAHEVVMIFCEDSPAYYPQMTERTPEQLKRFLKEPKLNKVGASHYGGIKKTTTPSRGTSLYCYPNTVIRIDGVNGASKEKATGKHPTQKPVALLSYLVKTYTNEGDTVLDNCAGSGSTLEAAMRNNRRSIGIERDANYYQVATQRLARVAAELRGDLDHLPLFAEAA